MWGQRELNLRELVLALFGIAFLTIPASVNAGAATASDNAVGTDDPYVCRDKDSTTSLSELKARVPLLEEYSTAHASPPDEHSACHELELAEIEKRLGKSQARDHYKRAIQDAPGDPAYSLFYADYLRIARGASEPLYGAADAQYRIAWAKLKSIPKTALDVCRDAARRNSRVGDRIYCEYDRERTDIGRGLSYLHARDGQPLTVGNGSVGAGVPQIYASSSNWYGYTTPSFEDSDDARDFTADALFSESSVRLNRPLTISELQSIAHLGDVFETADRVTLRWGSTWLDVLYGKTQATDAQITNFFEPTVRNNVDITDIGAALGQSRMLCPDLDLAWRIGYAHVDRRGLVEFLPQALEHIDQISGDLSASTYWGATKVTLDQTYTAQLINTPDLPAYTHDRSIYGTTLSFYDPSALASLLGPGYPFYGARGNEYTLGYVHDIETYGTVDVPKDDYFANFTIHAIKLFNDSDGSIFADRPFDFSVQQALLTSSVSDSKSQTVWEYRTDARIAWRIVDEDRHDRPIYEYDDISELPSLETDSISVSLPARYEHAVRGPDIYDNYQIGLHLDSVFAIDGLGGTKLLVSAGVDNQDFYRIARRLHLFDIRFSAGF